VTISRPPGLDHQRAYEEALCWLTKNLRSKATEKHHSNEHCPRKLLPADRGTMKRKPSKTGFTKLLSADTTWMSADPLIGLLELETDSGTIELAMNRIVAERLLSAVVEFLQAGEGDDAPTFCCRAFAVTAKHSATGHS
jgi:hypothetical protein